MNKLPEHVEKLTKQFTIENLQADEACQDRIDFVKASIEAGKSVPQALKAHNNGEWVQWAIKNGYDVRELWHDMDGEYSYTWDDHARMFVTGGDNSTLTVRHNDSILKAGSHSTLTGGVNSTLWAGSYSTITAGMYSTVRGGDYSTLITGDNSNLRAGCHSTLTAGRYSILKAGGDSTFTAGYNSTIRAGGNSIVTAENDSTLIAGHDSTFTAGSGSWLICEAKKNGVSKLCAAYVGDGGLKPNTPYKCIDWMWVAMVCMYTSK